MCGTPVICTEEACEFWLTVEVLEIPAEYGYCVAVGEGSSPIPATRMLLQELRATTYLDDCGGWMQALDAPYRKRVVFETD